MSRFFQVLIFTLIMAFAQPKAAFAQDASYKCMVQMTNYMGEGAYIAVSLINGKGAYEKTLYVMGSDKKWYPDIKEWHKAIGKKTQNISAITGASVAGGDRGVMVLKIDPSKIDKDYKLRFETAVEDKLYNVKDVEIPLTTQSLAAKSEGTGYIRYVRFSQN